MYEHAHPGDEPAPTRFRRWRRRWSRRPSTRSAPAAFLSLSVASDPVLEHVIDPDGTVWLFRISGQADLTVVDELDRLTASLDARHTVHLDLFDATIPSTGVVHRLERLADRLEQAMVRVRMVGVDPNHPAFDSST